MSKLTDAEILKALDTPYNRKWVIADDGSGDFIRVGDIIDLVYCKKAEVERLTRERDFYKAPSSELAKGVKQIKSEVIKEFERRIKSHAYYISFPKEHRVVDEDDIDNLVKEMEGE